MKNQKVALITGANRGLGFETARQLGQKDITVIVTARSIKSAQETADKLKAEGIDAYGIQLDVTKADERVAAAKYIADTFGKLDILVNNAGVAPESTTMPGNQTSSTKADELHYIYETNLFAPIYLTHELLPLLKKSEAGRIVNLSSILGSLGVHSLEDSPIASFKTFSYNSSKTALNAFTVHLADELKGTNIKVNSVHPGWVKTDMGSDAAPMEIVDGAKSSVEAALYGADGPTGSFTHLGEVLPW
jgi:NAD(P)-dependent dehydrogenase (short-subunit alcohol dehydrogenase family)